MKKIFEVSSAQTLKLLLANINGKLRLPFQIWVKYHSQITSPEIFKEEKNVLMLKIKKMHK